VVPNLLFEVAFPTRPRPRSEILETRPQAHRNTPE
jgi:hypothetical protein